MCIRDSRSISPKAAEVKAQYAAVRLKISPERRQIQIENRQLFSDLSDLAFVLTVLRNGKKWKTFPFKAQAAPGTCAVYSFDETGFTNDTALEDGKEYILRVSVHLEKDTLWAEKGYELAFSEAVLPGNWKMERKRFIPARMIDGDVNPVSYTHLDVYKRQVWNNEVCDHYSRTGGKCPGQPMYV